MANYTIEIKTDKITGAKATPVAGSNTETDTSKKEGLLNKEQAKAFGKGLVAYGAVKSFALQIANHEHSMVELRTGSKELQQRTSFVTGIAQKGLGVLESVGAGALVGGLPGALLGLATSVTHTLIGYAQAQNKIDTQQSIENQSIQMQYIRAGARGSRGNE